MIAGKKILPGETLVIFDEFLAAVNPPLYAYYKSIVKEQTIEEIFHNRLPEAYSSYLIIGGMPECAASWIRYRDPAKVSQIQRELIEIYENDFSKHNGSLNSGRILMVFRGIVSQLAKLNEKFMYGAVRAGGRARSYRMAGVRRNAESCLQCLQNRASAVRVR